MATAHPAGEVAVDVGPLSPWDVVAVARHEAPVRLTDAALTAIDRARAVVDTLAAATAPAYGISTGFGALATRHIPAELRARLQRSLVRSHAAGSGPEVEREVVRALMLLRLSTLATGHTGVRRETALLLAGLISAGITPVVREYGSLGCSGDLAPLAHCALALMGEGPVRDATGELRPAAEALAAAGLEPVDLAAKEGLCLINGTDGMLGMLLLAIADLRMLLRTADVAAAMSVEAQMGTDRVFAADLQSLRPQVGQALSAANLTRLLAGSGVMASHREDRFHRVQDAYSLRCSPQVHGAARDTVDHAALVAGRELASAIDNPVVLFDDPGDGRVESNGNFHGAPLGYVLDFLAVVAADVASISERRTDRFLDRYRSHDLPPFLADDPGVDSGLMIAQYTQAAIVSELKRLAVPASVDSIPSSAMQEDHVSMGWSAARKLRRSVEGLTRVVAIELLTAGRALGLRAPLAPPRAPGPRSRCCTSTRSAYPAPTASSPPRSRPPSSWSARVLSWPPLKPRSANSPEGTARFVCVPAAQKAGGSADESSHPRTQQRPEGGAEDQGGDRGVQMPTSIALLVQSQRAADGDQAGQYLHQLAEPGQPEPGQPQAGSEDVLDDAPSARHPDAGHHGRSGLGL